jgi:hypothetical protein
VPENTNAALSPDVSRQIWPRLFWVVAFNLLDILLKAMYPVIISVVLKPASASWEAYEQTMTFVRVPRTKTRGASRVKERGAVGIRGVNV